MPATDVRAAPKFWEKVIERLPERIKVNFQAGTIVPEFKGDTITLIFSNEFVCGQFANNHLSQLSDAVEKASGVRMEITCEVRQGTLPETPDPKRDAPPKREFRAVAAARLAKDNYCSEPHPLFTFENFAVGASNELTFGAAQQLVQGEMTFSPLVIRGAIGLGKTHLLHAIAHAARQRDSQLRIVLIHVTAFGRFFVAKSFSDDFLHKKEFDERFFECDVLLVDDLHMLSGVKTEIALRTIFDALRERGARMAFTSIKSIGGLRLGREFDSRLKETFQVRIKQPDAALRLQILLKLAKAQGIELTEEVGAMIVERCDCHARSIAGAVKKIIGQRKLTNLDINPEFVHALFGKRPRNAKLDVAPILDAVAAECHLLVAYLLGSHGYTYAQKIALVLCELLLEMDSEGLASEFDLNSDTVERLLGDAKREMKKVESFFAKIEGIKQKISGT